MFQKLLIRNENSDKQTNNPTEPTISNKQLKCKNCVILNNCFAHLSLLNLQLQLGTVVSD